MTRIINIPRLRVDSYGRVISSSKKPSDFNYLLHHTIEEIIKFEDGTDELKEAGSIILPRHYYIFEGRKDDELQYKGYEYDPYRIVVTTYRGIIYSIDSIG